jgi:predicted component of type VI protein secretion system
VARLKEELGEALLMMEFVYWGMLAIVFDSELLDQGSLSR